MVHCCVPGCNSDSGSSRISFHEIPSSLPIRDQWLSAIRGYSGRPSWAPNQYSSVCGKHFTREDYKVNIKYRILKAHAVPSIFPEIEKREDQGANQRSLEQATAAAAAAEHSDDGELFRRPVDPELANLHLLAEVSSRRDHRAGPS